MYASVDLTIIGLDNGLSPGRCQAIIWNITGILSIGPLGINYSKILTEIQNILFNKMRLKMSSRKWRPNCLGFNVLKTSDYQWADGHSLSVYWEEYRWTLPMSCNKFACILYGTYHIFAKIIYRLKKKRIIYLWNIGFPFIYFLCHF